MIHGVRGSGHARRSAFLAYLVVRLEQSSICGRQKLIDTTLMFAGSTVRSWPLVLPQAPVLVSLLGPSETGGKVCWLTEPKGWTSSRISLRKVGIEMRSNLVLGGRSCPE